MKYKAVFDVVIMLPFKLISLGVTLAHLCKVMLRTFSRTSIFDN